MTSLDKKITRRDFLRKGLSTGGVMLASKILPIGGAIIGFLSGCKDKKKDIIIPPTPVNHDPSIITTDLGGAIEGQDINQTIEGDDIDGNYPLNFYITDGPAGASISPVDDTHALLSYIPTHEESDQAQDITIEVQDSTGKTAQRTYSVPVTNVSDVIITARECGSGNPIQGIDVTLGSDTQPTDSAGIATFPNKPTGSYPVVLKDPLAQYVTYKPRNIEVSRAEEDAGNLTLEKKLLPESHFDFMEPTVRNSGEICKFDPNATLIFDIYKINNDGTSGPVPQANIDVVKNIILNKLSDRYGYAFTNANIAEYNTLPVLGQPENNHITIFWDNNYGGGWNLPYTNGTRILSAATRANTSNEEKTWMNEFANLFTNSDDSNLIIPSVRNQPTTESDFTYADNVVDDFYRNRPEGNKNLNDSNPDNRDVDPNL